MPDNVDQELVLMLIDDNLSHVLQDSIHNAVPAIADTSAAFKAATSSHVYVSEPRCRPACPRRPPGPGYLPRCHSSTAVGAGAWTEPPRHCCETTLTSGPSTPSDSDDSQHKLAVDTDGRDTAVASNMNSADA